VSHVEAFARAVEAFFGHLAAVGWLALALAVLFHVVRLACRVLAWRNILAAAYPGTPLPLRSIFGAYVAGVGVNALTPARAGDLVKLYLAKHRIAGSSYPTLGSSLVVETLFDFAVASVLFLVALQMGLLPGLPQLPALPALDWSFALDHPQIAAVLASVALAAAILLVTWASERVTAFRENVTRGVAILSDPRQFATRVASWQAASWLARVASVYWFLQAFHIGGTFETIVAVLVVQGLATMLPFTPGGAGTQQALLVFALAGEAARSAVLAFSVGMQIVTVAANVALGFAAIAVMMRTLRWRSRVLAPEEGLVTAKPAAARSRSAPRG
jgi:uncharacterized membrane protein YbhN (UPF0104 family)